MAPTDAEAVPLFEYLSPQATAMLLQRRDEHIQRLREGWQAERARLEASRDQTEAMFAEERAMMNDERLLWAEQRAKYQNEIMDWKKRAEAAELKTAELAKLLDLMCNSAAKSPEVFNGAANNIAGNLELGPADPQDSGDAGSPINLSPAGSPTMAESKPFVELDPRMQAVSPENPFLCSESQQVPSTDTVLIPGLEDVQLKTPATDKATFNDTPPHATGSGKLSPSDLDEVLAEAQFEPSDDDPALNGPLSLQNEPLRDEMFLRELWDKLEEAKATDATPAALYETAVPESTEPNDGANDDHLGDATAYPEEDIPLRFRQNSNFGQPFGQLGPVYTR